MEAGDGGWSGGDLLERTPVHIPPVMIPRALLEADPERVRGGKTLETPGTEEKETQKKDRMRKERKKFGLSLYAQGDKKGGKKWPAAKTSHLNSSFLTLPSGLAHQDKNATEQRISSATKHKITELRNEMFDLQRKIEAASSENQALRDVSRRQSRAIDKYSNGESHLQGLLAGHRHDVRELRKLLRMAQEAEKNTARELKRVEAELRRTKGDLKTLVVLSEDKELAEREELNRRLSVLNEELEAKEERIQSLEMELKLNNGIFSRQLASESKKLMEATMITNDLLVEINIVHQKIKEKDRQLYVRNIYANRMPKALRDRSDWVPNDQSLRVDRSVQVDKESLRELLLSQHQETEKNAVQLKEEKGDQGEEGKAKEVCSDAQGGKEKQGAKKAPMPQTFNRRHRGGKLLMEQCNFPEFIKEMEKQTEFFEQELKNLTKSEQNPPSDRVKENNQEEEVEKEEKKPHEQQKKKARSESVVPSKDPTRLKKKPTFPGAAENLHQGLHVSGAKSRAGSLRQAGQSCSNSPVPRGRLPLGHYEPSFGQIPLGRQEGAPAVGGAAGQGALWAGRREALRFQQHNRQGRAARQIPKPMAGCSSPR